MTSIPSHQNATGQPGEPPATRIACVRYLNTLPLIEGVDALPGVELIPAAPSHIAGMVRAGDADLGLVSLIDGPGEGGGSGESQEPLAIVPVGMIGCDGPTRTVRIFSRVPMDRVTRLHADTDSHTSIALARIILAERFGAEPEIVPFDVRERVETSGGASGGSADGDEWPETVLMIGDKVVTDSPPAVRYAEQLDLGEAWHAMTGLPFVYAVWMCRERDLADEEKRTRLVAAAKLLDRQRRHNRTRLDWIVATNAPRFRWPLDLAREYVGSLLRYDLDGRAWAGAEAFLAKAAEHGIAPAWDPERLELREAAGV